MRLSRECVWIFVGLALIASVWSGDMARAEGKPTLRVGYVPLLAQLPLIISYDEDQQRLTKADLKLVRYDSFTSVEAALRVSAVDAASIPLPIALSIAAEGVANIKILGACHLGGARLVTKNPGKLENLKGTLIGVPGLDSSENYKLAEVLSHFKLRPGLDFRTIDIPFSSAVEYLQNNKIDALYLPEPYGTMAEQKKVAIALEGDQAGLSGILSTVLVVRAEALDKNLAGVREWLGSVGEAANFLENDIVKASARQTAIIQAKYFQFPNEIVVASLLKHSGNISFKLFAPKVDEIKSVMDVAVQMRMIKKSMNLDTVISFDLIKKITG